MNALLSFVQHPTRGKQKAGREEKRRECAAMRAESAGVRIIIISALTNYDYPYGTLRLGNDSQPKAGIQLDAKGSAPGLLIIC